MHIFGNLLVRPSLSRGDLFFITVMEKEHKIIGGNPAADLVLLQAGAENFSITGKNAVPIDVPKYIIDIFEIYKIRIDHSIFFVSGIIQ